MNQGRIQDDFWRDSIWSNFRTYSTYPDRQAWANSEDPDQTPQNACKTFTETVMYLTKDLESLEELEFTCLFVTTNGKIWQPLHREMIGSLHWSHVSYCPKSAFQIPHVPPN